MSSNEVDKAKAAAGQADTGAPTIFDKLLSGEWKSDKVYEDDEAFAFRDVNPQAPVHILVIPKHRDGLTQLSKARPDQKALLGHLMFVASEIAQKECPDGFRYVQKYSFLFRCLCVYLFICLHYHDDDATFLPADSCITTLDFSRRFVICKSLVINDGVQGAQSVYHLHIHILGGRTMGWPPG